jgi:primosomal protein N'
VNKYECPDCGYVKTPTNHLLDNCNGVVVKIGGTWRCDACGDEITGDTICAKCGNKIGKIGGKHQDENDLEL